MQHIALARHVAMYPLRQDLGWPVTRTAEACGRKDHTTVLHTYQKVKHFLETDPALAATIEQIRATPRGSPHLLVL